MFLSFIRFFFTFVLFFMLFTFVFFSQAVAAGACRELFKKNHEKHGLRIQEFQFSKIALNHVLIADSESTQKIMQIGTGIMDFHALCVELRPFYWKKRISAPMYGIAFWGIMAGLVPTR